MKVENSDADSFFWDDITLSLQADDEKDGKVNSPTSTVDFAYDEKDDKVDSPTLAMDFPYDEKDDKVNSPTSAVDFPFFPIKDEVLDTSEELFPNIDISLSETMVGASIYDIDDDCSVIPVDPIYSICNETATTCSQSVDSRDEIISNSSALIDINEDKSERAITTRKPFFEEMWDTRYKELLHFVSALGHANVPHTYPENPQLARWVKRQRRQYKLRGEGKKSAMTVERINLLDSVGFVWDSHELSWRDRFEKLKEFRQKHGHCNVPSHYVENKLGMWVKCQRRQYKLFNDGKPSAMFPERIQELEESGFEWKLRQRKPRKKKANAAKKPVHDDKKDSQKDENIKDDESNTEEDSVMKDDESDPEEGSDAKDDESKSQDDSLMKDDQNNKENQKATDKPRKDSSTKDNELS